MKSVEYEVRGMVERGYLWDNGSVIFNIVNRADAIAGLRNQTYFAAKKEVER